MPKPLHHAIPETISDNPELAVLEQGLGELDEHLAVVDESFREMYESSSEEVKAVMLEFNDSLDVAVAEARAAGLPAPSMADLAKATEALPEPVRAVYVAIGQQDEARAALVEKLDMHVPEIARKLAIDVRVLEDEINYDMVASNPGASLLWQVKEIIGFRYLLEHSESLTYKDLQSIKRRLSRQREDLQEIGALQAEQANSSSETIPAEEYVAQLSELYARYRLSQDLEEKRIHPLRERLRGIRAAEANEGFSTYEQFNREDYYSEHSGVRNVALTTALEQRELQSLPIGQRSLSVDSNDYRDFLKLARSIDPKTAVEETTINGSPEGASRQFDVKGLKQYLVHSIPGIALHTVKWLDFGDALKEDGDKGSTTLGAHLHSRSMAGSVIHINHDFYKNTYDQYSATMEGYPGADEAYYAIEERFRKTLIHEYGHALHNALPPAALLRWEQRIQHDPIAVTQYAEQHQHDGTVTRFAEDFADTVQLFITQPAVLRRISLARFNAMQEIYEEFMPNYTRLNERADAAALNAAMAKAVARQRTAS